MENFTPLAGLVGGSLIGLAAVIMMGLIGRIMGVSGISSGLLGKPDHSTTWRMAFVAGIVLAAPLYSLLAVPLGAAPLQIKVSNNVPMLLCAGLLVGIGSRLGSGCTSGHGVCGISRFSRRSIVATSVFMASAFATVFITHHLLGGL